MTLSFLRTRLAAAAVLAATALPIPALAADVELLPPGLLAPTSKEQTKPNEFKKPGPWRIGVSFGGVGNTWIVQMIQEMKYAASQDKNIGEFIFVEANWQAPKQVADVEDLLAKKVDAIIIGPISSAIGAPLSAKAAKTGIPVIVLGAFGTSMQSTVEIMGAGEVFGRQGGEYLRKQLNGKGNIWAFRGVAGVEEEQLRYNGFRKSIEGSNLKITQEVFGALVQTGIGFSNAIGRPEKGPENALGRARRAPKDARLGGFSVQSGRLQARGWRVGRSLNVHGSQDWPGLRVDPDVGHGVPTQRAAPPRLQGSRSPWR